MPELSTCSDAVTQFLAPLKYCDLCGAELYRGKYGKRMIHHLRKREYGTDDNQMRNRLGENAGTDRG